LALPDDREGIWHKKNRLTAIYLVHSSQKINFMSRHTINPKSQYAIATPGLVLIRHNKDLLGSARSLVLDYEVFPLRNLSFATRMGISKSSIKHEIQTSGYEFGLCIRKHFPIRRNTSLFLYTGCNYTKLKTTIPSLYPISITYIGTSITNGLGAHIFPYTKKRQKVSRLGFEFSIGLHNFSYNIVSKYQTLGLKYKIHK